MGATMHSVIHSHSHNTQKRQIQTLRVVESWVGASLQQEAHHLVMTQMLCLKAKQGQTRKQTKKKMRQAASEEKRRVDETGKRTDQGEGVFPWASRLSKRFIEEDEDEDEDEEGDQEDREEEEKKRKRVRKMKMMMTKGVNKGRMKNLEQAG